MKKAYCPDCDRTIQIYDRSEIGDEVMCDYCEAEFEIVRLNPVELEWAYTDEWDDNDDNIYYDINDDYDDD